MTDITNTAGKADGQGQTSSLGNTNCPEQPNDAAATVSAHETAGFLDMPILLPGEDPEEYAEHLSKLREQLQPFDLIDEKMVRDLAYYEWSSLRYRKILTSLVEVSEQQALERILQRLIGSLDDRFDDGLVGAHWTLCEQPAQTLARHYAMNKPDAVAEVERLLAKAGLTRKSIQAEAMAICMYEVERIDRMMRTADSHCHTLQRELERRRTDRARGARRAHRSARQTEQIAPESAAKKLAA